MFTPFVSLQEQIHSALRRILERDPAYLQYLAHHYLGPRRLQGPTPQDVQRLHQEFSLTLPEDEPTQPWVDEAFVEILGQQLVREKEGFTIRNVRGRPLLSGRRHVGVEEYLRDRSPVSHSLRTEFASQPAALREGDVLLTGCRVLSEPREGGNGSVLLHLTGGFFGHWIGVPARVPIALWDPRFGEPPSAE